MRSEKVPFLKTVFVCTNARAGGRVACGNPGRGGLELCENGPNVFLYPDGQWLSGLTLEDVPEILKKLEE